MAQHYSDPSRESDPYTLPDVEVWKAEIIEISTRCGVFEVSADSQYAALPCCPSCERTECVNAQDDDSVSPTSKYAWWWWMPDSEPHGPFATKADAIADAQGNPPKYGDDGEAWEDY